VSGKTRELQLREGMKPLDFRARVTSFERQRRSLRQEKETSGEEDYISK
jgi:hypothetical protein